jgi:endonuclease/exonuclease/phosphatase family metal-dependent hydrolase
MGRQTAMPPLPGATQWHLPFADRLGAGIIEHPWLTGLAALGGAVGGFKLLRMVRHTIPLPLMGGLLAGGLVGVGAAWALGSFAAHRATTAPPGANGGDDRPAPSVEVHQREQLKVMTYNLHGGMGPHNDYRASDEDLDRLAEEIRRQDPDIVTLQEVDLDASRSSHRDVLAELSERLHPDSAVEAAPWIYASGRTQHVGVMTFHGNRVDNARNIIHEDPYGSGVIRRVKGFAVDARKFWYNFVLHKPTPPNDWTPSYVPRNTIDTIVHTRAGNDVRVLAGHYSGPNSRTDYQAESTIPLALRLDAWHGPTILGGDFNVRSTTEPYYQRERDALKAAGLLDTFSTEGIKADDDRRRSTINDGAPIDRIYVSDQFTSSDTHVVRGEDDPPASDHHPVVTTLELAPS